ncbi:MAG: hypothetical protein RIE86_09340 [Imperialibacter sp.]|uniref:hypothetical protein n=1 Tax=Imperialibacter sp. TaxID=2038411 RepID=UPI0032ED5058
MEATKRQIGFIKGLLKAKGVDIETYELEGITSVEASRMIQQLKGAPKETPEDKMKRKIISMAHTIGWELPGGRIDMPAVDSWCKRYGQYHKPLDEHNILELPHLVSQFQSGPFKTKPKAHA